MFNSVIDAAFGEVSADAVDYDFVQNLRTNNEVFAAFKTHVQQNELAAMLLDAEGKARTYGEFEKASRPIIDGYNKNWLKTEFDTATTRARFAANVKNFERDADVYPNMEWMPSRSSDRRSDHEIFYGTVLPINHPFWSKHHPGDLYNCKCGIEQSNAKATPEPRATDPKTAGVDLSPIESESLFTNTHPYIAGADKTAKKAVKKFLKNK